MSKTEEMIIVHPSNQSKITQPPRILGTLSAFIS